MFGQEGTLSFLPNTAELLDAHDYRLIHLAFGDGVTLDELDRADLMRGYWLVARGMLRIDVDWQEDVTLKVSKEGKAAALARYK